MFMTCMKHHVILPKMKKISRNRFYKKLHSSLPKGGGGGFIVTGGFGRDLNSIDNLEVKYEMSGS